MDAGSGSQHQWGRLQIGSDLDNIVVSVGTCCRRSMSALEFYLIQWRQDALPTCNPDKSRAFQPN